MIKFENILQEVKLIDVYKDEYPDENEAIWNFIGQSDFESTEYPVIKINPVEWFKHSKTMAGDMTIEQAYKKVADKIDRTIINKYVKIYKKKKPEGYIIVNGDSLIDGFHRIVAMALEGITETKAIDIK